MNFGMIILNQSIKRKHNYVTSIQTVLSFILKLKILYKDIANEVKKWFDTSGYNKNNNRPLPIGINKKVIGMFKGELNGKIMKEFYTLGAKIYAFLLDDDTEKKSQRNKEMRNKKKTYIHHIVYTEEINKIALSSNDDKENTDI